MKKADQAAHHHRAMIKIWETTKIGPAQSSPTDTSSYQQGSSETIYYWNEATGMLTEETVSEYAWPKRPDKCSINRKSREVSLEEVPDRVLEELEKLGLIRSLAEQLADDPARLNHRGKQGRTLLHLLEKPREIKALIAAGADLNAIDNDGNTPLHSAFLQHAAFPVEVTRLLVENGAKLDVQNNLGQTPLFCAVRLQSGHPNIVKILLEAGADPSIKDNEGLSIYKYLGYGRPKGEEDMKRYLEVARKKRMKPWSWS